jgi:hypothetical protein
VPYCRVHESPSLFALQATLNETRVQYETTLKDHKAAAAASLRLQLQAYAVAIFVVAVYRVWGKLTADIESSSCGAQVASESSWLTGWLFSPVAGVREYVCSAQEKVMAGEL